MLYVISRPNQKTKKPEYMIEDDEKIKWTMKLNSGTKFDYEEDAIQSYATEHQDFLNTMIIVLDYKDGEYIHLETKKIPSLSLGDISTVTKEDVDLIFWDNNPYSSEGRDIKELEENRRRIQSLIHIKIGKLIDFHDTFDDEYAIGVNYIRKNKGAIYKISCQGCAVCDEITRLRIELEKPWMRRTYYKLNYELSRFYHYEDGGFMTQSTEDLAYLLHDYLDLVEKGYDILKISQLYGTSQKTLEKILYFVSISPKYHKIVGLDKPAPIKRNIVKPGKP